jgi:AraC-like DNA-binding protein
MRRKGFDDVVLLANTELRSADFSDPYRLISEQQARAFYRNVVDLIDEPGIGLEIGWTTDIAEKGPLGLMQKTSRTVHNALEEGWQARYTYHGLIEWQYEIKGDALIHHLSCTEEYEPLRVFLLERALGVFQANTEELVDSEARPLKVLLDYKAPHYFKRYAEIFRCPIYFGERAVQMHYPLRYLSHEMESYDPRVHDALEVVQASLVKRLSGQKDIVNEVRMALRRNPGEFPRLNQVADMLAMSPRTLRRKLGAREEKFQDLLDEERRRVAEHYLANSDLTVQQIADQCDFSDAQNFSQAFKRWSGMSPTDYRNSHNH